MDILLVDNMDPVALQRLADMLRKGGNNVDVVGLDKFKPGELHDAALELAKSKHYDLVISDLDMGTSRDGIELLKDIRGIPEYEKTPAALYTSAHNSGVVQEAVDRLHLLYCPKGVSLKPNPFEELLAKAKEQGKTT